MENLLDKFIRNEKKAKLWAALSLFAFCVVATSVVVVAYKMKNGGDPGQGVKNTEADQTPDTVFISKEDPLTATTINDQRGIIRTLTDSFNNLQLRYEDRVNEVNKYIELLNECNKQPVGGDPPPPPPPAAERTVNVMIYLNNITYKIPDTSVVKLKNFIYKRDNTKTGMSIGSVESNNGKKPCIIYNDDKFADEANYISDILLKGGSTFYPVLRLFVQRGNSSKPDADIEIWPGYFR